MSKQQRAGVARARAEGASLLRAAGLDWDEVAQQAGYCTPTAAKQAVTVWRARHGERREDRAS